MYNGLISVCKTELIIICILSIAPTTVLEELCEWVEWTEWDLGSDCGRTREGSQWKNISFRSKTQQNQCLTQGIVVILIFLEE